MSVSLWELRWSNKEFATVPFLMLGNKIDIPYAAWRWTSAGKEKATVIMENNFLFQVWSDWWIKGKGFSIWLVGRGHGQRWCKMIKHLGMMYKLFNCLRSLWVLGFFFFSPKLWKDVDSRRFTKHQGYPPIITAVPNWYY